MIRNEVWLTDRPTVSRYATVAFDASNSRFPLFILKAAFSHNGATNRETPCRAGWRRALGTQRGGTALVNIHHTTQQRTENRSRRSWSQCERVRPSARQVLLPIGTCVSKDGSWDSAILTQSFERMTTFTELELSWPILTYHPNIFLDLINVVIHTRGILHPLRGDIITLHQIPSNARLFFFVCHFTTLLHCFIPD
jgi:hypothetical protein